MNSNHSGTQAARPNIARRAQLGMTLIELMVALVISLVVVLAAMASLTVARRGFSSVDDASQLRDNGRFAADLIQRIAVQAGYKDDYYAVRPCVSGVAGCPSAPNVMGMNNALSNASDPLNASTTRTAGTLGYGSDVLILRYQNSPLFPGSTASDKAMIDCNGSSSTGLPADRNDRMFSVLHVEQSITTGEPTLMCTTERPLGFLVQPLVTGVENFQVLYGVDGVAPNVTPTGTADTVPERYLRADQMDVAGDPIATAKNWRRVRSLRIGMILRGPSNSVQDRAVQTLYPFGQASGASGGAVGSAFTSSADAGTAFTPPNDGRLRQVLTFTVHLRNFQEL